MREEPTWAKAALEAEVTYQGAALAAPLYVTEEGWRSGIIADVNVGDSSVTRTQMACAAWLVRPVRGRWLWLALWG